jgi:thiol:disulfide interchange protein
MNKIKLFVLTAVIALSAFSGCKTTQQQAPVITKTEEEVINEIPDNQGISFFTGTLQEALDKAKAENKLLFVDCFTTWCAPCKMLKKYTFKDADLGDYMEKNYVCLAIDMENTEGLTVAKKYGIEAYPTLLFLDKYGRVVNHQVGGIGAEALLSKATQTAQRNLQ